MFTQHFIRPAIDIGNIQNDQKHQFGELLHYPFYGLFLDTLLVQLIQPKLLALLRMIWVSVENRDIRRSWKVSIVKVVRQSFFCHRFFSLFWRKIIFWRKTLFGRKISFFDEKHLFWRNTHCFTKDNFWRKTPFWRKTTLFLVFFRQNCDERLWPFTKLRDILEHTRFMKNSNKFGEPE